MIDFQRILNKDQHYYVAVSGGVDSIVIAHLMAMKKFNITIFHFNHKLSPQNEEMEKRVIEFAKYFQIPYIVKSRTQKLTEGLSLEAAAREARIMAYESLDSNIVVCHHLDDCVESYLMNCFRGHPEFIPIPIITELNSTVSLMRPFMATPKTEFQTYAANNKLERFIWEDQTNSDPNLCHRNWIRNTVLPVINDKISLQKVVKKIMRKWYKELL